MLSLMNYLIRGTVSIPDIDSSDTSHPFILIM
jgi:hypothetical protein